MQDTQLASEYWKLRPQNRSFKVSLGFTGNGLVLHGGQGGIDKNDRMLSSGLVITELDICLSYFSMTKATYEREPLVGLLILEG